jgi:hypothetical protein
VDRLTAAGPRAAAAALAVLGVALGGAVQAPPERAALQAGGYYLLAADFHVHSFPGDGSLPPWEIAREAARRRLDVVALTNHNAMLSVRLARALGIEGEGALLIPSQELTAKGYHLAAVGIDEPVDWRGPIPETAARIHAKGGVAIGAHPTGRYLAAYDAAAFAALDGVEVAHPIIHVSDEARRDLPHVYGRAKAAHPRIAAIGSSDYHQFAPVGLARTYLFAKSRAREGVLEAIRAGRTVACDARGQAYGPADLVALAAEECRAAATAAPAGGSPVDTVATWCVWLGLAALVVLGFENA